MAGKVYIAGAGPGDLGLVTLKCIEIIRRADVIIYDFLINSELLLYAKSEAEKIYAGKKGSKHEMEQEMINRLMVEKARENKVVLRLKGGDPFIFGRGGEELEFLKNEGIPYEVIPGVSSAIAGPAYAGIPLTHRDFSSQVLFVTGHEAEKKETSSIDWKLLASFRGTLVFLMGMKNLAAIRENLLKEGKSPETDVCIIEWGTTSKQRVLVSTLKNVEKDAKCASFGPPAIIVVGDVVKLRHKLLWFENLPLFGKKIGITRPLEQSLDFAQKLREKGADVIVIPTIKIVPIFPNEALERAIESIGSYFGIIFTSENGVRFFFQRFFEKGYDSRDLYGIKIFAIGAKTASRISSYGIRPDYVPDVFVSEGLIEILKNLDIKGKSFLFPRAYKARDIIPDFIQRSGGRCDVIALYRTEMPEKKEDLSEIPDMIVFTSSSTAKNFISMYGAHLLRSTKVASIGPSTSKTLKEMKIDVHVEAKRHDVCGLVDEIVRYYREACL